ncbi:MAG: hypothetical protein ACXV8P_04135 [Methylobacter sp.]
MHESYQPVAGLLSELAILTDFKVVLLEFLARQTKAAHNLYQFDQQENKLADLLG